MNLREPIDVEKVLLFKDGGSVGFVISDANKQRLEFGFSGRGKTKELILYVGSTHPLQPGAVALASGGPEEAAFFSALKGWVDSHISRESIEALFTRGTVVGMTQEEIDLFRAEGAIRSFQRRNEGKP